MDEDILSRAQELLPLPQGVLDEVKEVARAGGLIDPFTGYLLVLQIEAMQSQLGGGGMINVSLLQEKNDAVRRAGQVQENLNALHVAARDFYNVTHAYYRSSNPHISMNDVARTAGILREVLNALDNGSEGGQDGPGND